MSQEELVRTLQSALIDGVFFALGLAPQGVLRRSLGWVFAYPTKVFARYLAAADDVVIAGGPPAGGQKVLVLKGVIPR